MDRRSFFGKTIAPLAALAAVPISINGVQAASTALRPKTKYLIQCDPSKVSGFAFRVLQKWVADNNINALVMWCNDITIHEIGEPPKRLTAADGESAIADAIHRHFKQL